MQIGRALRNLLADVIEFIAEDPTRALIIFVLVFVGLLTFFAFRRSRS